MINWYRCGTLHAIFTCLASSMCRPFQERHLITWPCTYTHSKACRSVIKIACVNQTFDCTFLITNCLCLIKICAYSHVIIKQTAVIDYQIQVTFISILILEAIDSTQKLKRIFSVQFRSIQKVYLHMKDRKKAPD